MTTMMLSVGEKVVLPGQHLSQMFDALTKRGYTLVGPAVRDGAIMLDTLVSVQDLPVGWTDRQEKATYRLEQRADKAYFGYTNGPQSWKKYLYPPTMRLWQSRQTPEGMQFVEEEGEVPSYAFIGVHPCELHAIGIQDKVFLQEPYTDPYYQARREKLFIVTVNCNKPGATCFCASMGTGPKATEGFDLSLTEVIEGATHYFLVEIGSERGAEIVGELDYHPADAPSIEAAEGQVQAAATQMKREVDLNGLKELLFHSHEHPRWENVATRCMTCSNCTLVCPTCFCANVEDTSDLTGEHAERWRKWGSCFTVDFSYIHGGSVRTSIKARYRQWLSHKFSTWVDQFGTFGCVGCGRCITWCPVGIDITEEVKAIQAK